MFVRNWYKLLAATMTDQSLSIKNYDGTSKSTSALSQVLISYGANATSSSASGYRSPQMARVVTTQKPSYGGVAFGTGSTLPTMDDIALSGSVITTLTASVSVTKSSSDDGATVTAVYTLVNTGTDDITVSEVAMFAPVTYVGSGACVMVERTVLDNPVTIPGNSGVGQVTYTVHFAYPTE